MNPFKAVGDWLVCRTEPIHRIPFENDGAGFYASPTPAGGRLPEGLTLTPLNPAWREAMGRCGTDCHIRDHHDALRELGHTALLLQDARRLVDRLQHDRDEALVRAGNTERQLQRTVFARDMWRERALRAETRLRHPSTGDQAA